MTFQDIFKSNFLDHVNSITMFDMVLTFFLAFAVGLLIFFIYKRTFSGVMYSSSFGISLIGLTLITTFVIMANQYECGAFPGNGRFPLHCPISNGSKKNQWILYFYSGALRQVLCWLRDCSFWQCLAVRLLP